MKVHFIIGLAIFSLIACSAVMDNNVRQLRIEKKRIQSNLSTLDRRQRVLLGVSTEGTSVTAYRENGKIRKIEVDALGEIGRYLSEFYFKSEQLIFAHIKTISYASHIMETSENSGLDETVEQDDTYFFIDQKLIHWIKSEENVPPSQPGYKEAGKSVLAEVRSFIIFMETPPPEEGEDYCNWMCVEKENGFCIDYQCK